MTTPTQTQVLKLSDSKLTLTANDVALAFFGVAHMVHFWKQQPKSDHVRQEIAKCEALADKLNAISDHYDPPQNDEGGTHYADEDGEAVILTGRAILNGEQGDGK